MRRAFGATVPVLAALALGCGGVADPPARADVTATGPDAVRQGDVVRYEAVARDADGNPSGAAVSWSVIPPEAGFIREDGAFVGYTPGTVRVVAAAGGAADTLEVTVAARGVSPGSFSVVGRGEVTSRFTSDLWAWGPVVYTGTWSRRIVGPDTSFGDALHAWDIRNPANPVRTATVTVQAFTVNDVKIRDDGTLAVLTHEGSPPNGITLLDMSDPFQPAPITRFAENLGPGVHNVWIDGNFVYAVSNGVQPELGSGLQVIDVTDPASPSIASSFFGGTAAGGEFLHDVYVRDGLAFLSHWNAGLVILDVGNGIQGGSPRNPVKVSQMMPRVSPGDNRPANQIHNAWYWPATGYVFLGEEDFSTPGRMHVVDARDLGNPRHVASYRVAGDTPHNFWVDEEREILYVAWYSQGIRALDVSGELLGDLERQGREIAALRYDGSGACPGTGTCTWAPQLHEGLIFVADMNSGLWVLRPEF